MNRQHLTLAGRIRAELTEIERVVQRAPIAWQRAQESLDDLYLDSAALNLHVFYSGVERLFELISQQIDQSRPDDGQWHQNLLRQMAVEIPKLRPAVISHTTRDLLDEYRGFRHVVRNVYAFNLNPSRMQHLVEGLDHTFKHVQRELIAFANLLESAGD